MEQTHGFSEPPASNIYKKQLRALNLLLREPPINGIARSKNKKCGLIVPSLGRSDAPIVGMWRGLMEVMHARFTKRLDRISSAVERLDHRLTPDHLMELITRMRKSAAREYSPEHLRDVAAGTNAVAIDLQKFCNQLFALLPHVSSSRTASSLRAASEPNRSDIVVQGTSNRDAIRAP